MLASQASAVDDVKMQFRGTLRAPPPCSIDNGSTVEVDFGQRVGINKVDGVNYRQEVAYSINCESPGDLDWGMAMEIKGAATAFDRAAVQATGNPDLGIRLYQNGQPFTLNESINIDPTNRPKLEAVPVARPGAVLKEGAFVATATLQVSYQ